MMKWIKLKCCFSNKVYCIDKIHSNLILLHMHVFPGVMKFKKDIEMMLGRTLGTKIAFYFFIPMWCFITPACLVVNTCTTSLCSSGSVVKAFAPWAGGRGFDPRPRHTKDVIKMVPDASLLSAQHTRTGLASLSSQTSLKKRWILSGMSGRE